MPIFLVTLSEGVDWIWLKNNSNHVLTCLVFPGRSLQKIPFFSSSKLEFALLKWPAGEHLLTIFIGQSIHHLLLQEGNCWDKQQTMKKAEQRLENEMLWRIRTWENSHQPIPGNPGGQLHYQSGKRLEDLAQQANPLPAVAASHLGTNSSPGCPTSNPVPCCGLGKQCRMARGPWTPVPTWET